MVPADRRQRMGGLALPSVKPFQAVVGDRTDKTQGWVYMAYTERPSCPGALLR